MAQRAKSKKTTSVAETASPTAGPPKPPLRQKPLGSKAISQGKSDKKQSPTSAVETRGAGRSTVAPADVASAGGVGGKAAGASRAKPAAGPNRVAELEAEAARLRAEIARMSDEIARLQQTQDLVVNRIDWVIDSLHNLIDGDE